MAAWERTTSVIAVSDVLQRTEADVDGWHPPFQDLFLALAPFDGKLRPPAERGPFVQRPGLDIDALGQSDLVLITAGAGYGKTTLLAYWTSTEQHAAWLTLTEEDNDPATLAAYLVRALNRAWPLPEVDLACLSEPGATDVATVLPRLARLISGLPTAGSLVLDDVHVVTDPRCLRILETVLLALPPGSRALVSGRSLPAIGLQRLGTQRRVLALTDRDLALSLDQARDLIAGAELVVEPARAERIHRTAEGWPAGVYLVALACTKADTEPPSEGQSVAAYLHEQVLDGLDASTLEFLTESSVLDELDGPTCDAVLRRTGSRATLAHLADSHLLVMPIDVGAGTYRYHGLLRDVLRSELERLRPGTAQGLHARASRFFADRGDRKSAVRHAVHSGDRNLTDSLVWQFQPTMLGLGQGETLVSWLKPLAEAEFELSPVLATTQALAAMVAGDGPSLRLWLDIAGRHQPSTRLPDGTLLGSVLAMLDAVLCDRSTAAMLESAERSIAFDDREGPFRLVAMYLRGVGLGLLGDPEAASLYLNDSLLLGLAYPVLAVAMLSQLAALAIQGGEWAEARHAIQRGLGIYQRYQLQHLPNQVNLPAAAAVLAAHDGDATAARAHITLAQNLLARMDRFAPWISLQSLMMLTRAEHELGNDRAAGQLLAEARPFLADLPDAVSVASELNVLTETINANQSSSRGMSSALTMAEIRLLGYLPTHLTYAQIADDLCVSVNTVKSQTKAIFRKLDVESRHDAVLRGAADGLLHP